MIYQIILFFAASASSALFDVTLMTVLLRHFHIKKEPIDGYDKLPVDQEHTPAADLARIKYYRNIIAHSTDGAIDETSYEETWKSLCEVSYVFHFANLYNFKKIKFW